MSTVEIIPETPSRSIEPPQLLVQWSSPWEEFKSAIRPALSRPPKALAGEAHKRIFPYRGLLASWAAEALLLWIAIVLPGRLESLRPYTPPAHPKYDVLYYYGDELPRVQDSGGAQAGKSGLAGGQEARHRTQTIRVTRNDRPSEKVVDAPKLNLPRSDTSVANLLAYKPLPGPPPSEGLRSASKSPELTTNALPPAPELNSTTTRKAESFTASIVAPAPEVSHATTRKAPDLSASIVAPAPEVSASRTHNVPSMTPSVVVPAPTEAQRSLASSRVPLNRMSDVVAPPVSAPQRDLTSSSRLSLPAPVIVAPPPSQVSRELNSWGSSAIGNVQTSPVPPPPSANGGSSSKGRFGEFTTQAVAPPAETGTLRGGGSRGGATLLGSADVVPPPPGLAGGKSLSGSGTLLGSADVVPPPPGLGGGKSLSGSGRGNKGPGNGGPLDLGTVAAPPAANTGGTTAGSGIVVSNQPGTKVGVPNASGGAIAMSPTGSAKSGLGGSGGGNGIGKGTGPASGMQGEKSGAGKDGTGPGSDPNSRAGISPYPGPGGAGKGTSGSPAMPGVSVEGGNTITLPSFGDPHGNDASGPGHSNVNGQKRSGITVIATSRSGGVFNRYGELKGDRVYSIYFETAAGMAVMQYADAASAAHPYPEDLIAPEPMRKDLPAGLPRAHVEIACILDRSGTLKDVKVLVHGPADTTAKILSALPNWKFRPAFRGSEPVEVNAILGFGVDTR